MHLAVYVVWHGSICLFFVIFHLISIRLFPLLRKCNLKSVSSVDINFQLARLILASHEGHILRRSNQDKDQ